MQLTKRYFLLSCLFLICIVPRTALAQPEESDVVSRSELMQGILPDANHPVPRKIIKVLDNEITCRPEPKKILAIHYRAKPTAEFSLNDDRIVIALEQGGQYKIVKVLEFDAAVVDGKLYSDIDFEEDLITLNGMYFLYIRQHFSGTGGAVLHDVYSISSNGILSTIPFQEKRRPKLLGSDEELRNGAYRFEPEGFSSEAGIYKPQDAECCASGGTYHARLVLSGDFKEDAATHVVTPNFQFIVQKEWRTRDNSDQQDDK